MHMCFNVYEKFRLHHFMLFDIFLKRSKGAETRCNEDIDLSDGFESIVRVILEIVLGYLTLCKILT